MIDLILKAKTKYLKRTLPRTKSWSSYDHINTVSVFFDISEYEQVLPTLDALKDEGKTIRAWSYCEKYNRPADAPFNIHIIERDQMNFWYLPKKHIMDDYFGYPCDLLLDFSHTGNPVLEYLTACSPALFRAGFKVDDPKVYDFILDIRNTEASFEENAEMLLFYLKKLRIK